MEWHVLFTKVHLIYGMVCFIHKGTPNLWNGMFYSQGTSNLWNGMFYS